MNPNADTKSGRRLNQCDNRHSSISCQTTTGTTIDITPHYEFAYILGTGYENALGSCGMRPFFTGPYAVSHAGGMLVRHYEHLLPNAQDRIGNFLKATRESDQPLFSDMVHDGSYGYSCEHDYFSNGDNYTCGLQQLFIAGTFPGAECSKLRPASFENNYTRDDWNWFFYKKDAGISDKFLNVTLACVENFGILEMFPLIKKMNDLKLKNAFINVTVPVNASHTGLFNPTSLESLTSMTDIGDNCSMSVIVQVGSPGCDDDVIGVDTVLKGTQDHATHDAVAQYELEKFGFKFSETASLWHRKDATGCERGCCDSCFQWHCPFNNKYTCNQYSYQCSMRTSTYNMSSEQNCGEDTLVKDWICQNKNVEPPCATLRSRC